MSQELLLKYFDRISDAPDAIPRLRQFILDLAVRGKLLDQERGDEPASQLLARIRAESPHLLGQTEGQEPFRPDEEPFVIPGTWRWARLGDRLELINGRAFKPTDWLPRGLPIVRIQNLNNEGAPFNYCDPRTVEPRHIIRTGTFLISWSGTPGTSFGAFIWERGPAALNQHIFSCFQRGEVYFDRFLQLAINGRLDEMIAKAHGGVGLQHITKGKLEDLALPVPPVAEQHRIVAKVDELMSLCDRLEKAQKQREIRRDRLTESTLSWLSNGADADDLRQHSQFFINHLTRLSSRPDQIRQLRQTVMTLAVCGKLIPQDASDELAIVLLDRIEKQQNELVRARALKRDGGPLRPSPDSEAPFEIPVSWRWATLRGLIVFGPQNGLSPRPSTRPDAPKAITLTATTKGVFDPQHYKHVEANVPEDSELWLRPGDLLFQRGNTREYVGMAAPYTGEPRLFLYPDLMIKVRLSAHMDLRYVHLCAVSPYGRAYFSGAASGAQATMPKINQGTLLDLPLPVPPLVEQRRIVAKVDELMSICDGLEVSLNVARTESVRLLDAVLHESLNPANIAEAA